MPCGLIVLLVLMGCAPLPAPDPPRVIDLSHARSLSTSKKVRESDRTMLWAPDHEAGDPPVDRIPTALLAGPGAVIDIREACAANPDYQLTYLDVRRWESRHGRIPNGAVLLVMTGRSVHWQDVDMYTARDASGRQHLPGLSIDVANYLTTYRDLRGVGIDALRIDPWLLVDDPARTVLQADGVFLLENLNDLHELPPTGTSIAVAPQDLDEHGRAACRVLAHIPDEFPPAPAVRGDKYLLEFGWDIPDERTLRDAAASGTPFDGAVFEPHIIAADGSTRSFTWMTFGAEAIADDQVQRIIDELKNTPAPFLQHSFLRFNVTPGDVDWFDDWAAIFANARAAARIVRESKCGGLLIDVEQYEGHVFDYRTRPPGRSFEDYEAQVRERGREFSRVIGAEHASIEILVTFGYSLADRHRPTAAYGLLPAFLDGLYEGADAAPGMTLIDGYEYAYPFKSRRAFERGRAEVLRDGDGRLSVAFGIWMDWNSGRYGWHVDEVDRNWFSPDEFATAVGHALELSDRYVWVYTERLNWWTGEDLPAAYVEALRNAVAD